MLSINQKSEIRNQKSEIRSQKKGNSPGVGTASRLPPPPAGGARGGNLSSCRNSNTFPPLNPPPQAVGETSNVHPDQQTWGVTKSKLTSGFRFLISGFRFQVSGYTLIELSIALVIIGVIAGMALSAGVRTMESVKVTQTRNKMDKVESALIAYFKLNRKLPCPARGDLATSSASFGVEDCPNTVQSSCAGVDCDSTNLRVGVVPVATLGIAEELMFDGWGRRITYAMHYSFNDAYKSMSASGNITVLHYNDAVSMTTSAVYVVFSHGKNGHGAWKGTGSTTRTDASVSSGPELQHADTIGSEKSFDKKFRAAQTASDFDDLTLFKTAGQLFWATGAGNYNETCELAKRTLCPLDYTTTPYFGPVGCLIEAGSGYDQECLDRQTTLARTMFDSGACLASEVNQSVCR